MTKTDASYKVLIDWDDDGLYTGTGEDVSTAVRSDSDITWERGRDAARQLAPPMAGTAAVDLDNRSRNYSPNNPSAPLAGLLDAGRNIRYRTTWLATTYELYTGITDDIEPDGGLYGRRIAHIPSLGVLSRLRGTTVSTALYTGITTGAAIGYLLDAAGWPAGDRTIATGKTTLLYWWCEKVDAFAMLVTLLNTEGPGAAIFEDGAGKLVFQDRHNRLIAARSTTSQGTFRDSGAAPWHRQPFEYNAGLKNIINRCEIDVNNRTLQTLAVVWTYGATLTLAAYETVVITVTANDPFTSAVTPVVTTDYVIASGAVGSLTMSRTSGQSTELTFVGGPVGASITGLQMRAQLLTKSTTRVRDNGVAVAATSIARRGLQTYTRSVWPEIARNTATDFCNAIVGLYAAPRATVSITTDNSDDAMMTHVLNREISDKITIVETQTGLNDDFFIEHVSHKITSAGHKHEAVFSCELASTAHYALWGTARWGYDIWGF